VAHPEQHCFGMQQTLASHALGIVANLHHSAGVALWSRGCDAILVRRAQDWCSAWKSTPSDVSNGAFLLADLPPA